jgi:hypothetical protein
VCTWFLAISPLFYGTGTRECPALKGLDFIRYSGQQPGLVAQPFWAQFPHLLYGIISTLQD